MTVFKLNGGNRFRVIREVALDYNKPSISFLFTGQSLKERWGPIPVRAVKDPRGRLGDLVYFEGHTPPVFVFTRRRPINWPTSWSPVASYFP